MYLICINLGLGRYVPLALVNRNQIHHSYTCYDYNISHYLKLIKQQVTPYTCIFESQSLTRPQWATEQGLKGQNMCLVCSGTSIIRPPMGQVLLVAIRRWPEYNVNWIKRFAHLWHKRPYYRVRNYKCAMINMLLLTQTAWTSTTKSKWVYPGANRYTRTRFLNRGIGSCLTSTIYAVCEEGMAPREGSNSWVRIEGGFFQGSPPRL